MSASEKFFVDVDGVWIGCFWGGEPENGIEVSSAPQDARQIWNFTTHEYGPIPIDPAERVPAILAQARLSIVADVVEGASIGDGLASCSVLDAGLIWCEFPAAIDGEYLVWPSNGATHRCYSLAEEQFPEGFAVRSVAYEGGESFPERLQILVTKS
jgi:hypothetical protein